MYRWSSPSDDTCVANSAVLPGAALGVPAGEAGLRPTFLFAAEKDGRESRVGLKLLASGETADAPPVVAAKAGVRCRVEVSGPAPGGRFRLTRIVPPPRAAADGGSDEDGAPQEDVDDEVVVELTVEGGPGCRVLLPRTACRISVPLVERGRAAPLRVDTRAALLGFGWRRFGELVGLKRFTSGLSGSDVLVFRPRLRDPDTDRPSLRGAGLPGVVSEAWGSCLLVKTAAHAKAREEWDRFHAFLADRTHPFMGRSDAFLAVLPDDASAAAEDAARADPGAPARGRDPAGHATIIGTFLGGDLLRAAALGQVVRGSADGARCEAVPVAGFDG